MTPLPEDDRRRFVFRKQVIPPWLCYKLRDGEINDTDLLVMFVIDSLVRAQGTGEGEDAEGCWASDDYIAEAVGVSRKTASETLKKLTGNGDPDKPKQFMVLRFRHEGRRRLELEWSRTAEERIALRGTYGKSVRRAYKKLQREVLKCNEKVTQVSNEKVTQGAQRKGYTNGNNREGLERVNGRRASAGDGAHTPTGAPNGTNGASKHPPLTTEGQPPGFFEEEKAGCGRTWGYRFALEVIGALKSAGRLQRRADPAAWGRHFNATASDLAELHGTPLPRARDDLAALVKDHLAHVADKYQPKLYSAKSMCTADGLNKMQDARARRADPAAGKRGYYAEEVVTETTRVDLGGGAYQYRPQTRTVRRFVECCEKKGDDGRTRFVPVGGKH